MRILFETYFLNDALLKLRFELSIFTDSAFAIIAHCSHFITPENTGKLIYFEDY